MYLVVSDLKLMSKFSKNINLIVRGSKAYLVADVHKRKVYHAQVAIRLWTSTPDIPSGCWILDLPAFSSINTAAVEVTPGMFRSGTVRFPGVVSLASSTVPNAILDNLLLACKRRDFSDIYHTDTTYPVAVWEFIAKAFKSAKIRGTRGVFVREFPEYLLYQDTDAHLCIGVMATL